MAAVSARAELDQLFRRFLSGDAASITEFRKKVRPLVVRITRRHAPELVEDQFEDVIQETMMLSVLHGGGFNAARGDAVGFVGVLTRTAARKISAQFTPPGRQTRPPSKRDKERLEEFKRKSQIQALDDVPADAMPVTPDFAARVDAVLDTAYIMSVAPPKIRYGLERVFYEDASVAQVAAEIGIPRTSYNRMIAEFSASIAA